MSLRRTWNVDYSFFGRFLDDIFHIPKIGVPQNGWFIRENPIKMDALGYPYFWKHPYPFVLFPKRNPVFSANFPRSCPSGWPADCAQFEARNNWITGQGGSKGQFEVTPNGGLVRESPQNARNIQI